MANFSDRAARPEPDQRVGPAGGTSENGDSMKVTSARITALPRPMPQGMFDPMPQVWVTTEDRREQRLFEYYPDELSFNAQEFVGLTVEQARGLKFRKDRAFLRGSTP